MSVPDKIYEKIVESLPSLQGKCVAITGTTSGTGQICASAALKKHAACVLLLNRQSARSDRSMAELEGLCPAGSSVFALDCDLQSFASVCRAAERVAALAAPRGGLDVLCCNAGVMGLPDARTTDGHDVQMQTNHLSHFLLTDLLMPVLEQAAASRGEARVVQHSSGARGRRMAADGTGMLQARYFGVCEPDSLGGDKMGACFDRYHQTKLANSVFAMALDDKLRAGGSKVKSICAEPGVAATSLATNLAQGHAARRGPNANRGAGGAAAKTAGLGGAAGAYPGIQSAADGACPLMMAAFAADVDSGDFFMPGEFVKKTVVGIPVKCMEGGKPTPKAPWMGKAFDDEFLTMSSENRAVLWDASMAAVQVWQSRFRARSFSALPRSKL